MSNQLNQALASAAASSAMEGMPLSDKDLFKVQGFYDKLKIGKAANWGQRWGQLSRAVTFFALKIAESKEKRPKPDSFNRFLGGEGGI